MNRVGPQRLGVTETGSELVLDLRDAWHVALQGMTRSGKSVLTYNILGPLAACSDVLVCGADPTGILLGPWREYPGSQFRHLGGDMVHAADALSALCEEMDQRIETLLSQGLDKLDAWSHECPLLVVVLEEYPGLLALAESDDSAQGRKPAERLAPRIKRCVRRLVQEGAKVGVRLLLIAQRMDASIIGGAERSNFGLRITMRVDNADAVRMLHEGATPGDITAAMSASQGLGIFQDPRADHIARFRGDLIDYPRYSAFVRAHATTN